jgi:hypothetical protein
LLARQRLDIRRIAELEDRRVLIAARILNRTADQSRFRREPDGLRHNFRRVAKALFQVRRGAPATARDSLNPHLAVFLLAGPAHYFAVTLPGLSY